ncbi:MAG: RibD family protein, partial [Gemmataceae bacterium]|nr:RibD family protein [Gemmataceae bacterium]
VGSGTVVADDPLLTARPPGPRTAARVVLTASGVLPADCQLRATARDAPVIVYTLTPNAAKLGDWATAGAEVVPLDGPTLGVDDVLLDLGRRRLTNVLVEGGAKLLGSLLDARAADEFHVFVAPKLVGGNAAPSPVGGFGVPTVAEALALSRVTVERSGEDVYVHGFADDTRRSSSFSTSASLG